MTDDAKAQARRIVEEGTHEELIARGQVYRRLHDQQMLVGRVADDGVADAEIPSA